MKWGMSRRLSSIWSRICAHSLLAVTKWSVDCSSVSGLCLRPATTPPAWSAPPARYWLTNKCCTLNVFNVKEKTIQKTGVFFAFHPHPLGKLGAWKITSPEWCGRGWRLVIWYPRGSSSVQAKQGAPRTDGTSRVAGGSVENYQIGGQRPSRRREMCHLAWVG